MSSPRSMFCGSPNGTPSPTREFESPPMSPELRMSPTLEKADEQSQAPSCSQASTQNMENSESSGRKRTSKTTSKWSWFKKDGVQSEIDFSNFCMIKIYPAGLALAPTKNKHAERLAFLRKVQEVRMTTSNTAAPPHSPTEVPEVVAIDHPEEEEGGVNKHQQTVSSDIRYKLSQRHFSKKNMDSSHRENLLVEAMEKLKDSCTSKFLHVDVRVLHLEGLVTGPAPSPFKGSNDPSAVYVKNVGRAVGQL